MLSYEIPDEMSKIVDWACKDVYRDQDSPSWSPYTRGQELLTVWAVEQAQGVIDNGGFQYFFENDWPERPSYSLFVDAFQRIGAVEAADCIADAVEMFPSKTPHLDYQMRRDFMDSLREKEAGEDSVIDKLGDRVIDLGGDTFTRLSRYVLNHLESFPTARKNAEQTRRSEPGDRAPVDNRSSAAPGPGEGWKARAGFRHATPVIAALEQFHRDRGSYPTELEELVPTYLSSDELRLPVPLSGGIQRMRSTASNDLHTFSYDENGGSFDLGFSYEGPGMNYCVYDSKTKTWHSHGYY